MAYFSAALQDPDATIPRGLRAPPGVSVDKRFAIYRNNVASSLADALEDGFPVVRQLLGERYFRALAVEFARAHPPTSPVLSLYGEHLPAFIDTFPPLADKRWLADVARLELLRRDAHDARDERPCAAEQLDGLSPDALPDRVPHRHPATRWLTSAWPVLTLWRHQRAGNDDAAEAVLVVRPSLTVNAFPLPHAGALFLALADGVRPLGEIAAATLARHPDTDLPGLLALLVQSGALSRFDQP